MLQLILVWLCPLKKQDPLSSCLIKLAFMPMEDPESLGTDSSHTPRQFELLLQVCDLDLVLGPSGWAGHTCADDGDNNTKEGIKSN